MLKSGLCLLILFGFYKLLLEDEKLHQFNRFYLLFSLVFSLVIPLLTINIRSEQIPVFEPQPNYQPDRILTDLVDPKTSPVQPAFDFSAVAGLVYWLITLMLLIRFGRHLFSLAQLISQHRNVRYQDATLILLPENGLPHTFLHYLFVGKSAYESQAIEPELFTHELTHIRQKHSFDILFVELLFCFYWFNPLLFLIKRAIRLNHEFLADAAVIDQHQHVVRYQRLLLSKLTLSTPVSLTSQLTFHATKQRFLMMTKRTSRARVLIVGTLALSLLVILVATFSTKLVAQVPSATPQKAQTKPVQDPLPVDSDKFQELYKDKLVRTKSGAQRKFSDLSKKEKKNVVLIAPFPPRTPTDAQFSDWKNPKLFGIWIDDKRVKNEVLDRYKPTDIASFSGSFVHKNARQPEGYLYQMDLMTHSAYERYLKEQKEKPFLVVMQRFPKRQ
ncbi:BlaR1 peptidase M56 [Spirosoma fluviale]|uniref:BlaR1 peptidase M56 n=2 Tax=Spirosoma fluviale TaxID=1597977 RepID=A0A286GFB5_9BACT|nr:BlaR1 peptidase M56 [Spirosoma fluviale]